MEESYSSDIKGLLLSMNNNSPRELIDRYNSYFGEDSYDDFLAGLNEIENKYMLEESYKEEDLERINGVVKDFLIRKLDDEVKSNQISLRIKEIVLEEYGSKMNGLVDKYTGRSFEDELPIKTRNK